MADDTDPAPDEAPTDTAPTEDAADEAPDPKAFVGAAFSAAAATYDDVIDFFGPYGRALATAAGIEPGHRVLDVACGRGASLRPALAATGPTGEVVGIDLAAGMVERLGAELAADGITNAVVTQGDAEALEWPDASFDRVLAGFMIFFVPRPQVALGEMARVLRPGGRVALSVFDGPSGFAFMRDIAVEMFGEREPGPAEAYMATAVLEDGLREVGLRVLSDTTVEERFTFTDVDHVIRWMASHGGRMMLDVLDAAGRVRFEALVTERLADHAIEGGFELVQSARISVAERP